MRASWGTAFKAPTLYQLWNPATPGLSQAGLNDPLRCPDPDDANYPDCATQFTVTFGGNPVLQPEKATQTTIGGVWKPMPGISIGADVLISWGCTLVDHDSHSLQWKDRAEDVARWRAGYQSAGWTGAAATKDWTHVPTAPIHIGDKAWIGFGVTVLRGVTIGEGAIVGARSVVTADVPPWTVAVGTPATERIVSLRSGSIARNRATCQVASSAVQAIRHAALERRTGEQPTSMPNTAPMQGSKAQAGSW